MTDHYDLEMYNFLTKPESFRSMVKLAEQFPNVRRQLIEDFWDEVIKRIKELDEKDEWIVIEYYPRWQKWWGIQIEKRAWRLHGSETTPGLFALRWEEIENKPFHGLWVNADHKNETYKKLMAYVSDKTPDSYQSRGAAYWPFWQYADQDFRNNTDLELILPEVRQKLVDEYAQSLWQLSKDYEKELDQMATLITSEASPL